MNDYTKGVLETIGFVLSSLRSQQSRSTVANELERIRKRLLIEVAQGFEARLFVYVF